MRKIIVTEMEVQVIISDLCSEIDLKNRELLKLVFEQPGACVRCISGTLWLTQESDLHDHLLEPGSRLPSISGESSWCRACPAARPSFFPQLRLELIKSFCIIKVN